jgi:ADP-ribose pyrophosphatase YjhB (NUDIX family)
MKALTSMAHNGEFNFCPYCGTRLERMEVFSQIRPACRQCGFVQFRDPKVAVIAFVTHKDKVLLVRRAVEPSKGKWALPGGYMDAGEMPEEALSRELDEEVGLGVNITRLLEIFPMESPGQPNNGIVLAYEAEPETDDLITLQSKDDVSAAGWFGQDELPVEVAFESTETLLSAWKATLG